MTTPIDELFGFARATRGDCPIDAPSQAVLGQRADLATFAALRAETGHHPPDDRAPLPGAPGCRTARGSLSAGGGLELMTLEDAERRRAIKAYGIDVDQVLHGDAP